MGPTVDSADESPASDGAVSDEETMDEVVMTLSGRLMLTML